MVHRRVSGSAFTPSHAFVTLTSKEEAARVRRGLDGLHLGDAKVNAEVLQEK